MIETEAYVRREVERLQLPIRWQIRELAADCSLEYDVLINTHILDSLRWAEHARHASTLWREVRRDGVMLHEVAVAAPLD